MEMNSLPYAGVLQYVGMHPVCWGTPVFANNPWHSIYWGTPYIGVPQCMLPHLLGSPSICGCIPSCWGTPVYRDASPYVGVPQYLGIIPGIASTGVPRILGCPSVCFHIFWGRPAYVDASPHVGVLRYIGMHPRMMGCPSISVYLVTGKSLA
jgi:hypothetical protein